MLIWIAVRLHPFNIHRQHGQQLKLITCSDSPYSLFAFTWLKKNKEALAEHGVAVEYALPDTQVYRHLPMLIVI